VRDLIHFSIDAQGRVRITQAPPVGAVVIFSENYLANRAAIEEPGVVTWPSQPGLPLIDEIITVNPDTGTTMTFKVVDISPYEDAQGDVPDPSILVYYCTRLN
jgi:hypothetical protein